MLTEIVGADHRRFVQALALAAMAAAVSPVALLGAALSPASAQEQDRSEGPAQEEGPAEDEGGGEEDGSAEDGGVAEEDGPAEDEGVVAEDEGQSEDAAQDGGEDEGASPWAVSVTLNRALLVWEDGRDTHVYAVDNNHDVTLEGEVDLGQDWTAGLVLSLETTYAPADSVDQFDRHGDGFVAELTEAYVSIGHPVWGTLAVGNMESASDDIDNINLAGSDEVADASVDDWIGDFYLRATGFRDDFGLATGRRGAFNVESDELRWGDYIPGLLAGESGRFITYVSPEVRGFEASASVGQPQEIFLAKTELEEDEFLFNEREGGVYADAALRYSADWNEVFRVRAGIGAWRDTTEERNAEEPTEDTGAGGSLAVMHIPTGLNLALNYSFVDHTERCAERGEVSGRCRGDDRFFYVRGGLVRDWIEGAPTALYGEYYKGWRSPNESDDTVALAFNEDAAEELKESEVTVWGVGVAQQIMANSAELYVGYRRYQLDVDLIGAGGRPVHARDVEDIDVVRAGLTIRLGNQGSD